MLKTIKTTKQMRLDELIKYVWDNGITNTTFKSNYSAIVRINEHGDVRTPYMIHRNDLFTVEIEEPIADTTRFKMLVEIDKHNSIYKHWESSFNDFLNERTQRIYALIDGRLELVWERDGE